MEGDGGRCRVDGITYKVTCKRCEEVYVGETSKNAYTRGLEHLYSVTAPVKDPSKPKPTLRAHVDERHSEDPNPPTFKMEVTGVYAGDATVGLMRGCLPARLNQCFIKIKISHRTDMCEATNFR